MNTSKLPWYGLAHAAGTAVYIFLVVSIMNNASRIFGNDKPPLTGLAVLMLFVVSAAIVGALVLGKPIVWFLNGNKSEAIKLFSYTVGWLLLFVIVLLLLLATILK